MESVSSSTARNHDTVHFTNEEDGPASFAKELGFLDENISRLKTTLNSAISLISDFVKQKAESADGVVKMTELVSNKTTPSFEGRIDFRPILEKQKRDRKRTLKALEPLSISLSALTSLENELKETERQFANLENVQI
ncbi:hypothetical protein MHBO_001423 [Bonamia ostreae]|uniref:Uncharacterized protein n=1 Tax=Bonamia ostreae TaxID=126728 RepID=A0ABV2AIX2_9EUKA